MYVFGKYAYTWDGEQPLKVGDLCRLPGNWLFPNISEGVVTSLGTDYTGELSPVLSLIKRGE